MASNNIRVPASSLYKHVTVTVTITGENVMRVRLWCAMQLIKLAAYVAGVGLRFDGITQR